MSDTADPGAPTSPTLSDTDEQHAWMLEQLGLDTRGPALGVSPPDGPPDGQAPVVEALAETDTLPPPTAPIGEGEAAEAKTPKTPKVVKLTLVSETEVAQPPNRARTKLGVGERVTLKLTPVGGDWKATGAGTVKPAKGATVTLTAAGKAGKVTVSVTAQGKTEQIVFDVIAPNSVHLDVVSIEHEDVGVPNAGFHGRVFCGPADVNFANITFLEAEIPNTASGCWSVMNGLGHGPGTVPIGFSETVVAGKGTKSNGIDRCWSGYDPTLKLADWTGLMTYQIPWTYECDKVTGNIATIAMITSTSKDGTTSTKKAGGSSGDHPLS